MSDSKIHVIPMGSSAEIYLPYWNPHSKREAMALFFGRIAPYKGLATLVNAGLYLKEHRLGPIKIVIAGPGDVGSKLRQTISSHADSFELYDKYHSPAVVAALFQRASVCVLPYDNATQSSVPSIAAGFGVPIVSSNVGGLAEDVRFFGGLVIPPRDPIALAHKMMEAIGSEPKNRDERCWAKLAPQFIAMYQKVH